MKTQSFVAHVLLGETEKSLPGEVLLQMEGKRWPVDIFSLTPTSISQQGGFFICISIGTPLMLKWGDPFEILRRRTREHLGQGKVLYPSSGHAEAQKIEKRSDFLSALSAGEKEMLAALCRERGTKGLREKELKEFSRLSQARLQNLSQKLEQEGRVKILAFSPLFLISRESFDFLAEKILALLSQYHQRYPGQRGMLQEKLMKRLGVPQKIFSLTQRRLIRSGMIQEFGQRLALSSHEASLSPRERKILEELETIIFKGEFQSVSWEDIRRKFRLSSSHLEKILSYLIERKKIFQGPEGLYLHSHWLTEIIEKIRAQGKKELSVPEFKEITGLSRKYAIPLLELLDQMGVTRRKGPVREII